MCLASVCRLRLTLEGNWWRAKQFPHVVRGKTNVPSLCLSSLIEQPTTLWLTKVASTILTKCHLSGPGMSTANVEQKKSDSVPGQCVYRSTTEQDTVEFDRTKKDLRKKWSLICHSRTSQRPGKNVEKLLLPDWDLLIQSIQSQVLSIDVKEDYEVVEDYE